MRRRKRNKRDPQLFEPPGQSLFKNLTWTCHICLDVRPDDKISVLTKIVEKYKDLDVKMTENIRYCNDRPECIEGAKTYSHFHLHGGEEET